MLKGYFLEIFRTSKMRSIDDLPMESQASMKMYDRNENVWNGRRFVIGMNEDDFYVTLCEYFLRFAMVFSAFRFVSADK